MEKVIKWFSENHVAGNFLMLIIVALGFSTWFKLKKEVFPEIALDIVKVSVIYPNATPEEVEEGVLLPLEDAVSDVAGVRKMSATATEGVAALTIEIENGYVVRDVLGNIKNRVDAITIFPKNTEKPVVEEVINSSQVLSIAVSGDLSEGVLRRTAEKLRDGLLRYETTSKSLLSRKVDITKVSLAGVRPYEVAIEIKDETLRQYGLTLSEVADIIKKYNFDAPLGSIREQQGEVLLRTRGKINSSEELKKIPVVNTKDGRILLLGDIANIRDGFKDVSLKSRFGEKRAVLINVFRTGEQDATKIAAAVKKYLAEVAPLNLPKEVKLEIWNDTSKVLQARLKLLGRNGAWGLFWVFIVLALFLRPSLAFLVAIGIPVSFAGGVWLMPQGGVSINMITAFAFIMVLGIVVDDAIVVGEEVYRRIRGGEDPKQAAWKGTHEVGVVVFFGVFTTIAAFTPMLGLSGFGGKVWSNIPLVVIPVLIFSLIQSKFVMPAHLALLKQHGGDGWISKFQTKFANGLEDGVKRYYLPLLKKVLKARYAVWAVFTALLIVTIGLVKSKRIPFVFFPQVEGNIVRGKLTMPVGVNFKITDEAIREIERAATAVGNEMKGHKGESVIKHCLASAGTQPFKRGFSPGNPLVSSHIGEVVLELIPAAEREMTAETVVSAWRKKIGGIPGAVELTFSQETAGGGNAIDLEIRGEKLQSLKAASDYLTESLQNMSGVKDISSSWRLGKPELVFEREDITVPAKAAGLTLDVIARQIRAMFYGEEVQRIQRSRDEVKMLVKYSEEERKKLSSLEKIRLKAPSGVEMPIEQVLKGRSYQSLATISRVDGQRSIKISADVDTAAGANANEVRATFTGLYLKKLNEKFPDINWTYQGEQRDQSETMKEMGVKFIFALLMIYILMAIPLKSYVQPMIVMSVIPFGLLGAVWGHMILGMSLSIMSMCGVIALSGVVVNDSLVLVDYINRHRGGSGGMAEAVLAAGVRRFRPVLLTSLTTFAGLMPMLLETDVQAKFLIPMAVSLGCGILFATLITLFLVPSVYFILEDIKKNFTKSHKLG